VTRLSTILHRGDVVLIPFPFTDLTGRKVRAAVIVSPNPVGTDIILAFITSVVPSPLLSTDYLLEKSHPDFHFDRLEDHIRFQNGQTGHPSSLFDLTAFGKGAFPD